MFAADDFDALLDQFLVFVDGVLYLEAAGWPGELLVDFHFVTRLALFGDKLDDAVDFLVCYERALGADQFCRAGRQVEHVALSEQFVGAHRVQNRARIHFGGNLKGDAGGDVRLDDAGDDVHARPLRVDDAMDAGRAGHLRDAGDGHFHVGGGHQHEVGEFVNDDDDVAELFGDEDVVVARHDDFLVHLDCEPVRAGLDFFLPGFERQFRFGSWQGFVLGALVERFDVAHAHAGKNLVAFLHFIDDPAQGEDDFLGVGHHRHHQVRQRIIMLQLDDLRIDHHEAQLIRGKSVEQRSDDCIDANRFARAGAPCD